MNNQKPSLTKNWAFFILIHPYYRSLGKKNPAPRGAIAGFGDSGGEPQLYSVMPITGSLQPLMPEAFNALTLNQ